MIIHEYALDYSKLADKAVMLCKGELDPLYVSAMRNFIMFHGFEENKPLARFYMEFIDEVGPPVYGNLKRTLLEKMQEKLSLPINEKRLKFIQMADDAIRISLVKSFFSGGTDLSLDEAIEHKVKLTLQMYNLPEDQHQMKYMLRKVKKYLKKYISSTGRALKSALNEYFSL